jgi:photoactive yellow protein
MNSPLRSRLPFGLLELDTSGAVIRYSPASEQDPEVMAQDILGRHFFTEVIPNKQVKDFRTRFHLFMEDGQAVDRFSTVFDSEEGQIKVQIIMARIPEKTAQGSKRLALVRISRTNETGNQTLLPGSHELLGSKRANSFLTTS